MAAEHGASFSIVKRKRQWVPWCAARHASGRRCNTKVNKRGQLCGYHERLVKAYMIEAERLQQIEGQEELKEFLRAYRYVNSFITNVADQVLDGGRRITPARAVKIGKIAAERALELTAEYRAGRLPEHLRSSAGSKNLQGTSPGMAAP